jgi:hypothetical protein
VPLFVAEHHHPPDRCPAATESGELLLAHVSAATAARYGVAIQAEAVIDGEHRLILVLEAARREQVERFMRFFTRYGSVEVLAASDSETVVARGSCNTTAA